MVQLMPMIIRVAAALIFDEQGNFLIAERSRGKLAGKWEFPGGKIEEGETEEEAVVREILEELGISVLAEKIIGVFSHTYKEQEIELTLVECSRCDLLQEIVSDGSHLQYIWAKFGDGQDFDFAPLDREIFDLLKKKHKQEQ